MNRPVDLRHAEHRPDPRRVPAKDPGDLHRGPVLVQDPDTLAHYCDGLADEPFICLDTEFHRERTFWPILCLVQVSSPDGRAFAVDPLAPGMDLDVLLDLLLNPRVLKVLHAASQDIETLYNLSGEVPRPLFDTQVAARACGFGETVGYTKLVQSVVDIKLDKTLQFTDWSRRPLPDDQLIYALDDVIHLPAIYRFLHQFLDKTGRWTWIEEDMAALLDERTYRMDLGDAWKRAKIPELPPRDTAVVHALAAAREELAMDSDLPRRWLVQDRVLVQIAQTRPNSLRALREIRGLKPRTVEEHGKRLLRAVREGMEAPLTTLPKAPNRPPVQNSSVLSALLRILLRHIATQHQVAPRLIASTADLERIAAGEEDVPALKGWRNEVFGIHARSLRRGDIALAFRNGELEVVPHS